MRIADQGSSLQCRWQSHQSKASLSHHASMSSYSQGQDRSSKANSLNTSKLHKHHRTSHDHSTSTFTASKNKMKAHFQKLKQRNLKNGTTFKECNGIKPSERLTLNLPRSRIALYLRMTWSCQVFPKHRAPHFSHHTWFFHGVGLGVQSVALDDPLSCWSVKNKKHTIAIPLSLLQISLSFCSP